MLVIYVSMFVCLGFFVSVHIGVSDFFAFVFLCTCLSSCSLVAVNRRTEIGSLNDFTDELAGELIWLV